MNTFMPKKLYYLDEVDKILKRYNLLKLTQDET